MRALLTRLAVLAGVVMVAALPDSTSTTAALALTAVSALLSVAVLRAVSCVGSPAVVTVGERARAHREALSEMVAPRHPSTAGRPMARAPGMASTA